MKKKQHPKENRLTAYFAPSHNNDFNFHGLGKKRNRKDFSRENGGKPKTMMSEYYF